MINCYQKFLPNLSSVLAPLHNFLNNKTRWRWGKNSRKLLNKLKSFLKSPKLMVYYDDKKELTLVCNASQYGLGAVLSHKMEDGSQQLISFASRTLTSAEKNYSNLETEALALVYEVKKFHQY